MNKIQNKNFCFKYIPYQSLKFDDIGYLDKACLIYEQKETEEKKLKTKNLIYKTILFSTFAALAYSGFNLISLAIASINFPYLYYLLAKAKKLGSSIASKIYLCKNGHQLIFKTFNGEFHLVNIKDINKLSGFNLKKFKEIEEKEKQKEKAVMELDAFLSQTCYLFTTHDKRFVVNTKPEQIKYLNSEIFETFNSRSIINTGASYSNYSRVHFPK